MSKKYSVILIEDEKATQDLLTKYIKTRKELYLKDIASDGKEALRKLKNNKFDLVFLDINLPYLSGFDVIKKLKYKVYFIVMNSEKINAYESNELGSVDFIKKPITLERFNQSVKRYLNQINKWKKVDDSIITFIERRQSVFIRSSDIIYLEAKRRITSIYTNEKTYFSQKPLKEFLKQLSQKYFYVIHKSIIVNITYAERLIPLNSGRYILQLKDSEDSPLPVSRKYSLNLKKILNNIKC